MKDSTWDLHLDAVLNLRERLDAAPRLYSPDYVRSHVSRIYGRTVSKTTWHRWLKKCGITQALLSENNGNYPEGAYMLLCANAGLLRGNKPKERERKVSRLTVVGAVKSIRHPAIASPLPEQVSADELRARADAQAGHQYSARTHERHGILKSQKFYSKAQAERILSTYPAVTL